MEAENKRLNDRYEKLQMEYDDVKKKNEQVGSKWSKSMVCHNQNCAIMQLGQEQTALQEELAEEKFMSQEAEEVCQYFIVIIIFLVSYCTKVKIIITLTQFLQLVICYYIP